MNSISVDALDKMIDGLGKIAQSQKNNEELIIAVGYLVSRLNEIKNNQQTGDVNLTEDAVDEFRRFFSIRSAYASFSKTKTFPLTPLVDPLIIALLKPNEKSKGIYSSSYLSTNEKMLGEMIAELINKQKTQKKEDKNVGIELQNSSQPTNYYSLAVNAFSNEESLKALAVQLEHTLKKYQGEYLIHFVVGRKYNKVLSALIQEDPALTNLVDSRGNSPLFIAVDNNNIEALDLLIKAGADPTQKRKDNLSFQEWAAKEKHQAALIALLKNGKSPLFEKGKTLPHVAIDNNWQNTLKIVSENKYWDINAVDEYGETPLTRSILNNNPELCQILIDNGADVNKANRWQNTPLSLYAFFSGNKNCAPMIQNLLAVKDIDVDKKTNQGKTAFEWALTPQNNFFNEAALLLLFQRSHVDWSMKLNYRNLLQFAVFFGFTSLVKYILSQKKINIDDYDGGGVTALTSAVVQGHPDVVLALIEAGADVNKANSSSHTILSLYASYPEKTNSLEIITTLLSRSDINVHQITFGGKTALEWAIEKNHQKAVIAFIHSGKAFTQGSRYTPESLKKIAIEKNWRGVEIALPNFKNESSRVWNIVNDLNERQKPNEVKNKSSRVSNIVNDRNERQNPNEVLESVNELKEGQKLLKKMIEQQGQMIKRQGQMIDQLQKMLSNSKTDKKLSFAYNVGIVDIPPEEQKQEEKKMLQNGL